MLGDIPSSRFNISTDNYNLIMNGLNRIQDNLRQVLESQSSFEDETEKRLSHLESMIGKNKNKSKDNSAQIAASLGLIGIGAIVLLKEIGK